MRRTTLFACLLLVTWPGTASALYDVDTMNINRWRMPVTDWGPFGQGGKWRTPTHEYLFGCGLWFGAIVGTDTLTTVGYNPNSGGSELTPGDTLGSAAEPEVMVYLSTEQWPPPQSRFPRAPQSALSDQDCWTLFNDLDDSAHLAPGRPLGLRAYVSGYAWRFRTAQDMVFFKYVFENAGADSLRRAYAGIAFDYDIGSASDDVYDALYHEWIVGESIYVDNLAIGYDYNNAEPGWDSVGAFGASVLRSPCPERASAIKKFSIDIDPLTDPDQYLTLAGYDYRTGVYCPIDSVDFSPADKRMLLVSGPFDLAPGALDSVVFVILASTIWPSRAGLACALNAAESIWTRGGVGVAEPGRTVEPLRFSVRPNPFRGTVRFTAPSSAAGAVQLFDASGRLVASLPLVKGVAVWPAGPGFSPGIYLARCSGSTLKLVKQE